MTTGALDTNIKEVDNKILDLCGLVKKTNYDAKTLGTEGKCFTTSDNNKFKSDILGAKIKQIELANKSDISNLVKKIGLKHKTCNISNKRRVKNKKR